MYFKNKIAKQILKSKYMKKKEVLQIRQRKSS